MIALSCALALGFALAFAAFVLYLRRLVDADALAAGRLREVTVRLDALATHVAAHTSDVLYHPKAADVAEALRRVGNVELAGRGR